MEENHNKIEVRNTPIFYAGFEISTSLLQSSELGLLHTPQAAHFSRTLVPNLNRQSKGVRR